VTPTLNIGIDVGSTTVKAVVTDPSGTTLWRDYRRHNTRQAATVRDFMQRIRQRFDEPLRIFVTGSGSRAVAPHLNARYVQEVNAVTYAVERLHPDTGSVVELGGQDAKVIIWKQDPQGRRSTLTFMNDKCAGGTGATIDKVLAKIGVSHELAGQVRLQDRTLHHIAAKCGVFAETDVVGLLKSGIDAQEIVVSLCNAVVKQNLEVLVRGNVLREKVLLLGGPHTYLPAFAELWRQHIPRTWRAHGHQPADAPIEELIFVPEDSLYFAAIGAVLFGTESLDMLAPANGQAAQDLYAGPEALEHYIAEGRMAQLMASGAVRDGLVQSAAEVEEFAALYAQPPFEPPALAPGTTLPCTIGVDGGSTSSKLALLDLDGRLIYQDYVLSQGNPIEDVRAIFRRLVLWAQEKELDLQVRGTGITGYASAILNQAFRFDLAVVETVAHMRAALADGAQPDIICDVGGQDIKVLFLKHGRVTDFRLNTQCSAGNGYFLQSMAEQFDVPVQRYAELAFRARKAPAFNYGCAVFMEQDRVNFQQLGWTDEEIMAGLALVLPLNIWNYVVQEPHIARFGHRFVLQGGTQKNLAAVKAQVDYIHSRVPHAEVHVHRHAALCGAIGAALEVAERSEDRPSSFVGLEAAGELAFGARNDASTRCGFCQNRCPRTFVDIRVPGGGEDGGETGGEQVRFISGNACPKGAAENADEMKAGLKQRRALRSRHPNLVQRAAELVFEDFDFEPLPEHGALAPGHAPPGFEPPPDHRFQRAPQEVLERRAALTVGIPRLLNLFLYAPFFNAYLRCLGVGKIVTSGFTTERLWQGGNTWGAIDPCFPAKAAPAHVWDLMRKKPDAICFPIITHLQSLVDDTLGNNACVIQMGTPEVAYAVFTKDRDHFQDRDISYWRPLLPMDRPAEAEGRLWEYFGERLGLTRDENAWAVRQGYRAFQDYLERLQQAGAGVIDGLVDRDRIGILVIGHPYHHDPGLNHGILDAFQLRGFPTLCIEALPTSPSFLDPLFGADERRATDIQDVWLRRFNRNTNLKIWAAKVAARHPNLAVIDLSSFKCGHDAPTYSYVDNVLDASQTPHFLFHDIDQNKPRASIDIRIQTIEYFLRQEEANLKAHLAGQA